MAYPEAGTVRNPYGKVGHARKQPVGQGGAKCEVVADFMDGQEEILVCGCAEDVGNHPELPRKECRLAQVVSEARLEGNNGEDGPFGQRFGAAQLGHLLMLEREDG